MDQKTCIGKLTFINVNNFFFFLLESLQKNEESQMNVPQNMVGSTHHILSDIHLELLCLIHIWPWMYVRYSIMYKKDEFLISIQLFYTDDTPERLF